MQNKYICECLIELAPAFQTYSIIICAVLAKPNNYSHKFNYLNKTEEPDSVTELDCNTIFVQFQQLNFDIKTIQQKI